MMKKIKGFTPLQIQRAIVYVMYVYSKVKNFIAKITARLSNGNARRNILPKRHFLSVTGFTPLQIADHSNKILKFGAKRSMLRNITIFGKRTYQSVTGFTLLEVLVVVVIVGILAALAIPQYRKASESSKAAEAYNNLNAIRKAEWTYYNRYNCFTGNLDELSIENPNNMPSVTNRGNRYFDYLAVIAVPGNMFSLLATRNTGPYINQTIGMDANGNINESNWLR